MVERMVVAHADSGSSPVRHSTMAKNSRSKMTWTVQNGRCLILW